MTDSRMPATYRRPRYHHINYLPAYPEHRRAKWDADDERAREKRLASLEADVARLKRRAA
jgi:hypothetical protein